MKVKATEKATEKATAAFVIMVASGQTTEKATETSRSATDGFGNTTEASS